MKTVDYTKDGAKPFTRHEGWTQVLEPELFNFADVGQLLCGTLLDLRTETIDKRPVLVARVEKEDGGQVKFRPSFDLRQKLGKRMLGKKILIVFDSEEDTGQESKMKKFRVFMAPGPEAVAPFVATDADVPDFGEEERAG
jgi:hypothetical protein